MSVLFSVCFRTGKTETKPPTAKRDFPITGNPFFYDCIASIDHRKERPNVRKERNAHPAREGGADGSMNGAAYKGYGLTLCTNFLAKILCIRDNG